MWFNLKYVAVVFAVPVMSRSHFYDHEQPSCRFGSSNNQYKVSTLTDVIDGQDQILLSILLQSQQSQSSATNDWPKDRCHPGKSGHGNCLVRATEDLGEEFRNIHQLRQRRIHNLE